MDYEDQPGEPGPGRGSSRRPFWLVVIAVVVLAGAGAAGFLLFGKHAAGHPAAAGTSQPAKTGGGSPAAAATQSAPSTTTPPTPSSSPTPSPPTSSGPVTAAAGLAGNPQAPQVVSVLDSYFTAINSHNYRGYIGVLTPAQQQGLTAAQFRKGFATTKDSAEMLTGISSADGRPVAAVTFTSHQSPADSVNGSESCTTWHISFYLQQTGNGYLIDKPPPSYHASYAAC